MFNEVDHGGLQMTKPMPTINITSTRKILCIDYTKCLNCIEGCVSDKLFPEFLNVYGARFLMNEADEDYADEFKKARNCFLQCRGEAMVIKKARD